MKRIGIPLHIQGDSSVGVGTTYIEFIERFGTAVILSPKDEEDLPEVDMLLCPGGPDVLPTSYGARPGYRTQRPSTLLEHFDAKILPQYIERGTPVFAVCRGFQSIWAMYGGRIEQNNNWHEQSVKFPQDQIHELVFAEGFKDYSKLIDKVTSRHHQCADASLYVPEQLEVIAWAKDGPNRPHEEVVEIFRHKTKPIFGVQFHPEDHDWTDRLSETIIEDFLNV